MSDATERDDGMERREANAGNDGDESERLAATLGFLAAGLGVASAGLPWTDALVFRAIAGLQPEPALPALVAAAAFYARRRGVVEREAGARLAAVASGALVAVAAAALVLPAVRGTGAPVGVGAPVCLALGVFAVGFAVADHARVDAAGLGRRVRVGAAVVGVAVLGLVAGALVQSLVVSVAAAFDPPTVVRLAAAQGGFALALAVTALGYVVVTRRTLRYFDVRFGRRDALWTVGGLVGMFAVLLAGSAAASALGIPAASHDTVETIRQTPYLGLLLVPVSLLLVGPGEELLMRNVVQKRLYDAFSRRGAVLVGCLVFTLVHLPAYATPGAGAAALFATLARLFLVSLVLGVVYERTESVVAAALAHGGYDAIQFGALFYASVA
ncbi:CPBP family intramembrane metalloprotease domain-containing protein [Halarchaeum grantii]|uniref:CPBP family intramembrane metalloprotease domain-containing protein n=1 Tax=Halarchaeum grantii TaxID=1193105 RepID=A0A830FAM7_9EURY|nr:type II CAAX endopeptidase family protein [Halarchaeum grantii]GGL27761.1 CPBP family intramembrane metalloprotease domain-containing protein [Halarchaeum grantii]